MARVVSLQSAGGALTLGPRSHIVAGAQLRGLGMPGVALQWFEGAGEGRRFRGGRPLSRIIDMPVKVYGNSREQVMGRFGELARILLLENAPTVMTLDLDGERWRTEVVRTGGGDYTMGTDTDGVTFLRTVFTLEAGAPYWERVNSEARVVKPGGLGIPLLGPGQSLVQLLLSDLEGTGAVEFTNTGDVQAWPTWRFLAPFSGFAVARDGLALEWSRPTVKTTGWIDVNSTEGTVKDENGVNRYDGLAPAPKFFSIPRGTTTAGILIAGATGDTRVNVTWHPRKVILF